MSGLSMAIKLPIEFIVLKPWRSSRYNSSQVMQKQK